MLTPLKPLTIAYLGDSTNVLHDMLVVFPRLGHQMRVATPNDPQYRCPAPVWARVEELECDKGILWTEDPREAVHGADVVVTDTWYARGYRSAVYSLGLSSQDLNGAGSREGATFKGIPRLPGYRTVVPRGRCKGRLEVPALLAQEEG